ncbi:MarR family winged helix-turn-helix transcriptional regulator [Rhizobium halophytocola]|uniref:DNA-binding MarR family transcriptional regulator n=1 Tax=Rhizobium halophytocola TaxID=735519 RepID=A0ABS4DY91_9HYPH|nr:MarR family winged helix-turn-helix transcriptional regulator [Rhizobium halophytocola]MBP1850645.1 DNA-binding MarR family transcriptional regulator [Rhizobium halophytocola]
MTEPSRSIFDYCNSSAARRAARQLGQFYGEAMAGAGLNGTQFALLSQISLSGAPTQKALAAELVMDLSALGHTLKPLIRDGLIEIIKDETDGRVRRVRLTPSGEAAHRAMVPLWQKAQARFDAAFGADRAEELRRTLAFISSDAFAAAFRKTPGD